MRIGIDLGGTKTEIACLDRDGSILLRHRIATPRGDYRATIGAIRQLVLEAETGLARRGSVGVGIPGAISSLTGCVKNANSTWLNGRPLPNDLEAALERPVRIHNDANCLAVSEAVDGAGAGAGVVFAAILGTGVGAGIAIDGKALAGRNAIAGEWGHVPLPAPQDDERPGPACWCGRHGCIESWLSGPAMAADHLRHAGRQLDVPAIVEGAAEGDRDCSDTLARHRERLSRALAMVVDILDPDVIVLGGGLSNIGSLTDTLTARIARQVFSDTFDTPIVRSRHGDSSGVRGAAWLW
jgi:fructokinase